MFNFYPLIMVRSYSIQEDTFFQTTQFDSEFGQATIITSAPLNISVQEGSRSAISISQRVIDEFDIPFEVRISEMEHFLKLLSLFNPKIISDYEKEISSLFPSSE